MQKSYTFFVYEHLWKKKGVWGKKKWGCPRSFHYVGIELVEMTIHTRYGGFDKLNHRKFYLLDIPGVLPQKQK